MFARHWWSWVFVCWVAVAISAFACSGGGDDDDDSSDDDEADDDDSDDDADDDAADDDSGDDDDDDGDDDSGGDDDGTCTRKLSHDNGCDLSFDYCQTITYDENDNVIEQVEDANCDGPSDGDSFTVKSYNEDGQLADFES
ncbi:hypothetical protein KDL45_18730, partial [bacterium]|nr:hypothetical protein [bacterium]